MLSNEVEWFRQAVSKPIYIRIIPQLYVRKVNLTQVRLHSSNGAHFAIAIKYASCAMTSCRAINSIAKCLRHVFVHIQCTYEFLHIDLLCYFSTAAVAWLLVVAFRNENKCTAHWAPAKFSVVYRTACENDTHHTSSYRTGTARHKSLVLWCVCIWFGLRFICFVYIYIRGHGLSLGDWWSSRYARRRTILKGW